MGLFWIFWALWLQVPVHCVRRDVADVADPNLIRASQHDMYTTSMLNFAMSIYANQ